MRRETPPGWRCAAQPCDATRHVARGWCRTHYQRWYRTGSPLVRRPPGPRPILTTTHTMTGKAA